MNNSIEETNGYILKDEEVSKLNEVLEDVKESDPELKMVSELPSNRGQVYSDSKEKGYMVNTVANINTATGEITPISIIEEDEETVVIDGETYVGKEEDYITDSFDDFLAKFDGKDVPIDINTQVLNKAMGQYFNDVEVNDEAAKQFANVILKFNNGDYKNNTELFKDLPKFMQDKINAQVNSDPNILGVNISQRKALQGSIAAGFISDLLLEIGFESVSVDLNNEIDKLLSESGEVDFSKTLEDKIAKLEEVRESCDEDQKETITKIHDALVESYKIEGFSKYAIKTKIKKIELEKPDRAYDSFRTMFEKNDKNIKDITQVIPTLTKTVGLTDEEALKLTILFCKYTQNYDPDKNIDQYTFMYYFITNILILSIEKNRESEVGKTLIEAIRNIFIERSKLGK